MRHIRKGSEPKKLTEHRLSDHASYDNLDVETREAIYEVIDGGKRSPGHYNFNSPMPLWGLNFQLEGKEYTAESEAAVRRRIDALVDYLESIQER